MLSAEGLPLDSAAMESTRWAALEGRAWFGSCADDVTVVGILVLNRSIPMALDR